MGNALFAALQLDGSLGVAKLDLAVDERQDGRAIRRGARDLVIGEVTVACVNTQSFRPVRIPTLIVEKLAVRCA